jgi:hypothetical protein
LSTRVEETRGGQWLRVARCLDPVPRHLQRKPRHIGQQWSSPLSGAALPGLCGLLRHRCGSLEQWGRVFKPGNTLRWHKRVSRVQ